MDHLGPSPARAGPSLGGAGSAIAETASPPVRGPLGIGRRVPAIPPRLRARAPRRGGASEGAWPMARAPHPRPSSGPP
jgi:hypothetical protein